MGFYIFCIVHVLFIIGVIVINISVILSTSTSDLGKVIQILLVMLNTLSLVLMYQSIKMRIESDRRIKLLDMQIDKLNKSMESEGIYYKKE